MKPFLVIFLLLFVNLISASVYIGEDSSSVNGVVIEIPSPPTSTFNNDSGEVNVSNFWDALDTYNTTQMDDGDGSVLNILESWIITLVGIVSDGSINSTSWNRTSEGVILHHPSDNVGIGKDPNTKFKLDVGGNLSIESSVNFTASEIKMEVTESEFTIYL